MIHSKKLILTESHKSILSWMHENIWNLNTSYIAIDFQVFIQEKCKVSLKSLGFTKKTAHAYVLENMDDSICHDYDANEIEASCVREELLVALTDEFLWELKSLDTDNTHEVLAEIETLLKVEV